MKGARVAVVANSKIGEAPLERLLAALKKRDAGVERVSQPTRDRIDGGDPNLVFVLGGDGTMLRASRMYPGRVLVGVDLGKVGFMSGIAPERIEAGVEKALDGELDVQKYRMLDVRVGDEEESILAANEAALLKPHPRQTCSVEVRVEEEQLFDFRCDGFIAATPLGSTAYALSAAGPIVSGDVSCYLLVPIAPHSLTSRPVVVGEGQTTGLRVTERAAYLSLDGAEPRQIPAGGRIEVRLSEESVRIGRTQERGWWRAVRRTFL